MNFLRTLLIIILIYYVIKIVGRLLFPIFFKKMMSSAEKKFNQQAYGSNDHEENLKEGETVIDRAPKESIKTSNEAGEYVDYEELE